MDVGKYVRFITYCIDLHFVVLWLEEDDKLYDIIQAKQIVESDILSLEPELQCKAVYSGAAYDVKVIAKCKVHLKSVVTELPGDTN